MTKTFTKNDLVRYVYGETSDLENIEIECARLCYLEVQETVTGWEELKIQLDKVRYFPSENSVKNIIDRAREVHLGPLAK